MIQTILRPSGFLVNNLFDSRKSHHQLGKKQNLLIFPHLISVFMCVAISEIEQNHCRVFSFCVDKWISSETDSVCLFGSFIIGKLKGNRKTYLK